ncbi:hypothetical protein [Pantoea sp. C2G6]|uniref:hypothetical protein n=1 Tax=Pantoea sp. C2G6 TaxID=3243084 RepID=UPI003EDA6B70
MEFTEEEKEAISSFLSQHWNDFFHCSRDFMSVVALHKLARKLDLSEPDDPR